MLQYVTGKKHKGNGFKKTGQIILLTLFTFRFIKYLFRKFDLNFTLRKKTHYFIREKLQGSKLDCCVYINNTYNSLRRKVYEYGYCKERKGNGKNEL